MASTKISSVRKNTESASTKPTAASPVSEGYNPSATVNSTKQAYTTHNSEKPSAYTSKYDNLINDNLNNILKRKQFSYDASKDALYNQYKDMYTRNGQTAMQDTMGNAALLTGGYGNSYATTAGQQMYNSYMQQLNDKIPELEQRAYERYRDETSDLYNQNNLLTNLDATYYGRYRDKMSDYFNDRDFYYNAYNNERNFDYGKYRDDIGDAKDDRNFAYQKERDSVSDSQWDKTFNYNKDRDTRDFNYQKERDSVSDSQWNKTFNYNKDRDTRDFNYQKERDSVSDSQWDKTFNYNKYRDNVGDAQWQQQFDYSKYRDNVGDSQWQQQFDYQKDRDAVSDEQWNKTYSANVSKAVSSAQKESEDDTYFDPDKAYKFLTDYDEYFDVKDNPSEVAEALFQSYGDKDGFWEWADKASIGSGSLSDLIYSLHPELADSSTLNGTNSWGSIGTAGIQSNANAIADYNKRYSDYKSLLSDSENWSTSRQQWMDDNKKAKKTNSKK